MFLRCKEFMKIGKSWQGENWDLVDLKIGGGLRMERKLKISN
jgi:hypothetical protein